MNNENFHPIQKVPPLAHALHKWDETRGVLTYEYNGLDIIKVEVPIGTELGFRHGSDGSMQSVQYIQQIYLASDTPCEAKITFYLNKDSINMKPRRAGRNEAILGTSEGLLSYNSNGIYDSTWDMLIDWHGKPWAWTDTKMKNEGDGYVSAAIKTKLSLSAMYINIRIHYYSKHLGYHYHKPWQRKPKKDSISGWCSWEAYRRDIDINKVEEISGYLGSQLRNYGMKYVQIDDGYHAMPLPVKGEMTMAEGWLTCDEEKFPEGHSSIIEAISSSGLIPGVWVNSNITNPDFVKKHPESVIWHDNEAIKGEWIDFLYNCDEETLKTHVEPLFKALKDIGYKYVKIDAIRHLLFDGLHECVRLGIMSNETAEKKFRAYLESTVNGMGDDIYYLCSWGEMHEVVGLADACRISMDANPTWAGVRMQLFESARWFHTQRILFLNDPDHVCVRTKPEWAKSVLSLISLSGELYMLSDSVDAYTPEKFEIIRKTLPPLKTVAGETGILPLEYPAYTWTKLHGFAVQSHETPVEMEDISEEEAANIAGYTEDQNDLHPFSSLWSFKMEHHNTQWLVMMRVATTPLKSGELTLDNIHLDPNETYIAYDFWKQKYLGEITESFACNSLKLGCCQVVAFHKKPCIPKIIASDRHVSMDSVSIYACKYYDKILYAELNGVRGEIFKYTMFVPDNLNINEIRAEGANTTYINEGIAEISVEFQTAEAKLWIQFY